MGNCCGHCCKKSDKRQYLRTRYNVAKEMSVEIESLIDNVPAHADSSQYGSAMTEYERQLLSERKFHDIVQYQIKIDAEIEAHLLKQEEQLRQEEEAFYEARRLAAQIAAGNGDATAQRQTVKRSRTGHKNRIPNDGRANELSSSSGESVSQLTDEVTTNESRRTTTSHQWTSSADWDIATAGDDDFEQFLSDIQLTPPKTTPEKCVQSSNKADEMIAADSSRSSVRPDLLVASEASLRHHDQNHSVHEDSDNDWTTDFVTADIDS